MAKATRMNSEERRGLILAAATRVFGDYGYVGATTSQVARAAGVSQPYVVRMFGTKERLFVEVLQRALGTLLETFRGVLAEEESSVPLSRRLALAYVDLISEPGLLLSLMHGFVLGSDPVIGDVARRGYLSVYRFLRDEAGFGAGEVQEFLAGGMMVNTMFGLRMVDCYDTDPVARELLAEVFANKLEMLLDVTRRQRRREDAERGNHA